jgi:hypothetical protein
VALSFPIENVTPKATATVTPSPGRRRSDTDGQQLRPAYKSLIREETDNAQLLALSGERSPYPGKLGMIETGAPPDLLLVDGDPIANIKLSEDASKNLVVIIKDGQVFKNSLAH